MEINAWISSVPKKEFSSYLLIKLFSSLVYTFMRRMRKKNPTALQMRKSMRQKNNVPVQICKENKAQINYASHLTDPVCSFSLGLHYSISREMVLFTPKYCRCWTPPEESASHSFGRVSFRYLYTCIAQDNKSRKNESKRLQKNTVKM